jgi:hypothetical protein
MLQLCFNFNRIHDSVGKALRTANQGRVMASYAGVSMGFSLRMGVRGGCQKPIVFAELQFA